MQTAGSEALNHPKDAKVPDLKQGGPIDLPKRKAGLPQIPVKVPDLRGSSIDDAHFLLQNLGLQFRDQQLVEGSGTGGVIDAEGIFHSPADPSPLPPLHIKWSEPPAGSMVAPGSMI